MSPSHGYGQIEPGSIEAAEAETLAREAVAAHIEAIGYATEPYVAILLHAHAPGGHQPVLLLDADDIAAIVARSRDHMA